MSDRATVNVKLDIDQANLVRELLKAEDERLAALRGEERERAQRRRILVQSTQARF